MGLAGADLVPPCVTPFTFVCRSPRMHGESGEMQRSLEQRGGKQSEHVQTNRIRGAGPAPPQCESILQYISLGIDREIQTVSMHMYLVY